MEDGDWIGTFNLWIVTTKPVPSIIYQQRGPDRPWAPNKLDVAAGGHYQSGEKLSDGLREVEEELGKQYDAKSMVYLGRKLYVGMDTSGRKKNNVIEVYLTEDNSQLTSYKLDSSEVYAIVSCPVNKLVKAHQDINYSFVANGFRHDGNEFEVSVNQDSFPQNWDNYHFKIALLIDRYFKGEKDLLY